MDISTVSNFALRIVTNEAAISFVIPFLAGLTVYAMDNYVKDPKAKKVAYEVAKIAEDATKEGTTADNFLDSFVDRYEEKHGKKPSAGKVKTALDIKDEKFKIRYEDSF